MLIATPVLFTIYINNIKSSITKCNAHQYTTLWVLYQRNSDVNFILVRLLAS